MELWPFEILGMFILLAIYLKIHLIFDTMIGDEM